MRTLLLCMDQVLDELQIPYVIIGDLAAAALGVPRTTADVDVVLLVSAQDAKAIAQTCARHGFRVPHDAVARLAAGRPVKFIFSRRFSMDIRLASFTLDKTAIQRAQVLPLFGRHFCISAPEDLIVYKLARWNPLDQEDVRHIWRRFGTRLDVEHLEKQLYTLSQEAGLPELENRWSSFQEREGAMQPSKQRPDTDP